MSPIIHPGDTRKNPIIQRLRHAPGLRGTLYLTAAAASLEIAFRLTDQTKPYSTVLAHLKTVPLVALLTGLVQGHRTIDGQ